MDQWLRSKHPCIDHRTLSSTSVINSNNVLTFKNQCSPKASEHASGIDFDIQIYPKGTLLSASIESSSYVNTWTDAIAPEK